ncbi:hypothetical protein F5148DRAFT_398178 [Russula earlei]|uniref:Uncharacterized protein n=1 Tax=Russula earlei TaxID=71964 RepID=A0ACC0U0Z9_9AGAM|nr:hypothetical protein F5148DRAFT_398178 [Russula earlei]
MAKGQGTTQYNAEAGRAHAHNTPSPSPSPSPHSSHFIMAQSSSPSEKHPPSASVLKESASDTPAADNLCPNLDDEVSAARGADLAIPQKREREVSLELAAPYPDDAEHDPSLHDHRSQSPVKKSRALSTPPEADENDDEEEDDDFVDALEHEVPIPSPRPSPPHEAKGCRLPQGADDNGSRNDQTATRNCADIAAASKAPDHAPPSNAQTQVGLSSLTPVATTPESQGQPDTEVSAEDVDAKASEGEKSATASMEHTVAPLADIPSAIKEVEAPSITSEKYITEPDAQPHETDDQTTLHGHAEMGGDSKPRETKRPTPPLSDVDGATKRPREDEDGDQDPNPRGAKRASPPPEKEKDKEKKERQVRKKSGSDAHAPSAPASPKSKPVSVFGGGGFLAYASMGSPFAAVKGPSLFGASSTPTKSSTITTMTTTATSTATSNTAPKLTITPSIPSSPPKTVPSSPVQRAASPTPAKRTGFEAFASAASPFASAATRTRSPVRRSGSPGPGTGARSNPFAIYATGGAQGLFGAGGAPAAKRARGDSESITPGESGESSSWREGNTGTEKTFGERLRAGSGSGGDEEDEADGGPGVWGEHATSGKWAEQEVLTGEEEDETIHSVRGKLFMLSEKNQWKERGTGLLRLNRRRVDRSGARLVMRKDAVFAVLLNVALFRGMSCSIAQERYLRFSVLTPGGTIHYNLRVGSAQAAADLLKAINDNIPHA